MKHIKPLSKAAIDTNALEIIQVIETILSALAMILPLFNKSR